MRISRGPRMDHTNPKMRVTGSRTGMWDWSGQLKSSGDFAAKSKKEDFTCSSRISRCKKTYVGLLKVILPTTWTQAIYHRKEQNKKHKQRQLKLRKRKHEKTLTTVKPRDPGPSEANSISRLPRSP